MTISSPRRILYWISGIGLCLVLLISYVVVYWFGFEALEQGAQYLKPWLAAWRALLFVLLIGGWPVWIQLLTKRGWLTVTQRIELLDFRLSIALLLILLEVLLSQKVLIHFVDYIAGAV
jgi:hypothetical protein